MGLEMLTLCEMQLVWDLTIQTQECCGGTCDIVMTVNPDF